MPSISQQDYIIIDWEGKVPDDASKKSEVDAQLKNIYLANPLALLSVLFKNFSFDGTEVLAYYPIGSFIEDDGEVACGIVLPEAVFEYIFALT